jgi:hypothetical protein
MAFEAAGGAAALEGVHQSFRKRLADHGLTPEEVEAALASTRQSVEGAEPAKPTVKVRIIGECPAETPCLHCHQTGEVKRITNASVVGGKSETLHEKCAPEWFAKL